MPNIRSSEVTADHVTVVASDGGTVNLTAGRVQAILDDLAQPDPDLTRQTVQRAVAQIISDTLGADNVTPDQIGFDYAVDGDGVVAITNLSFFG